MKTLKIALFMIAAVLTMSACNNNGPEDRNTQTKPATDLFGTWESRYSHTVAEHDIRNECKGYELIITPDSMYQFIKNGEIVKENRFETVDNSHINFIEQPNEQNAGEAVYYIKADTLFIMDIHICGTGWYEYVKTDDNYEFK